MNRNAEGIPFPERGDVFDLYDLEEYMGTFRVILSNLRCLSARSERNPEIICLFPAIDKVFIREDVGEQIGYYFPNNGINYKFPLNNEGIQYDS